MTALVLCDDGGERLRPATDARASFEVRTGALTTLGRIERVSGRRAQGAYVPASLAALVRERTGLGRPALDDGADVLIVSGRCALPPGELASLERGTALIEEVSGDVIAARLPKRDADAFGESGAATWTAERRVPGWRLLGRAWDIVRFRDDALAMDLAWLSAEVGGGSADGAVVLGDRGVSIGAGAEVGPASVLDASGGAVVIAEGARVRPRATIIGPAYIGAGSSVLDGAVVRGGTAIGPVCKVNGEVSGVIVQGHANKGHEGYAGDSWVGEWVNLGAGTTTSNLLNTYGEVSAKASPDLPRERTGLTFFGSIIGDHVKTAIGTRLMTGTCIGSGSMISTTGPAPSTVGALRWVTDAGDRPYRFEKFEAVMRAAMARRGEEPSDAELTRLRWLAGGV